MDGVASLRVRASAVAELVEHLGRKLHTAAFDSGLRPAQWSALRYLSRANANARTLTAFARFLGTTKSSASQTVRLLAQRGLVMVEPCKVDGRVKILNLTPRAQELLDKDPLAPLVEAIARETGARLDLFVELLEALIRSFTEPATPSALDGRRPALQRRSHGGR